MKCLPPNKYSLLWLMCVPQAVSTSHASHWQPIHSDSWWWLLLFGIFDCSPRLLTFSLASIFSPERSGKKWRREVNTFIEKKSENAEKNEIKAIERKRKKKIEGREIFRKSDRWLLCHDFLTILYFLFHVIILFVSSRSCFLVTPEKKIKQKAAQPSCSSSLWLKRDGMR